MDLVDEKKPFDVEVTPDVPETMPDPDETLGIEGAGGRVWVVKVGQSTCTEWARLMTVDTESTDGTMDECTTGRHPSRYDPSLPRNPKPERYETAHHPLPPLAYSSPNDTFMARLQRQRQYHPTSRRR